MVYSYTSQSEHYSLFFRFHLIRIYRLLGLSAFAGFFVLLAGWPLNSYVSRKSVRIQKGLLTAHDKRMGVLDELIRAVCFFFRFNIAILFRIRYLCVIIQVKFIKFFAWEDRWIARVMDSRGAEIEWMVKGKVNYLGKANL